MELKARKDIEEEILAGIPHVEGVSIAEVEAAEVGEVLRISITPKKEFEYAFDPSTELVEQYRLPEKTTPEPGKQRKLYRDILNLTLNGFYRNRLKAPLIFDFESVVPKMQGRVKAIKLFSYLCQKGSAFHCSMVLRILIKLVTESFRRPDLREYFYELIVAAGMPKTPNLIELGVEKPELQSEFMEMITYYARELLSKYGPTYLPSMDIDKVPEKEIVSGRVISQEACKEPPFKWVPAAYDESEMVKALTDKFGEVIEKAKEVSDEELAKRMEALMGKYLR